MIHLTTFAAQVFKENCFCAEFEMNGNSNIAFYRYYGPPGSQMCEGPSVMIW